MKRVAMALIRFYRRYLSGLKPAPTCRFTPTCSAYALEAFEKRGFFAGLTLTLWRILRCSPFSPAGYDPVPKAGFRTMPLRFSKYDKYLAEQEAAEPFQEESDGMISPDSLSEASEDVPSEDEA
jgi:putative membrane protein insertion efficiency factor